MIDCDKYTWGEETDAVGPLGIDYAYLDNCLFPHLHYLTILVMFLWVLLLMNLLANTASDYFSPTLGCICSKMHLAYDVAGVTFLAFGNGAPDFFALVASVSEDIDILVSAGALLGGSVFICTIVVGTIAIVCPCDVSSKTFYRDLGFYLVATTWVAVIAMVKTVSLWVTFLVIATYILYVLVVLLAPYCTSSSEGYVRVEAGDISLSTIDSSAVQTAFWHRDANEKKLTSAETRISYNLPGSRNKARPRSYSNDMEKGDSGGYKFLILNEDEDDEGEKNDNHNENDEPGIINLSGGFAPEFDLIINEDYVSTTHDVQEPSIEHDVQSMIHNNTVEHNTLEDSLLSDDGLGGKDGNYDIEGDDSLENRTYMASALKQRNKQRYQNILISLYWQQWLLRRGFHQSVFNTEWSTYSTWYKAYYLIEYPIVVLRDITIPTLDDSNWYKPYAVLHPIMDAFFIAFLFGFLDKSVGPLPVSLICVFAAVLPTACIYLLTHHSRAPKGKVFTMTWTTVAFTMCVVWIYLIAGELVTCLTALGGMMEIPPAFLGLTVLAWGNSLGDYCTNFSVAQHGLGEMAIAGCFGGPVFNILIGLGSAMLIGASKTYPALYTVDLDRSCVISIIFLYITLIATGIIVTMKNFRFERSFGVFLISLYAVYTVVQASMVFLF